MTEQIIMDNYLLVLKSTVEVYVHGTLESNNKDIRQLLKKNLDSTINMQETTYNQMVNNNWYNVKNIDTKTIKKTLDEINKK